MTCATFCAKLTAAFIAFFFVRWVFDRKNLDGVQWARSMQKVTTSIRARLAGLSGKMAKAALAIWP